MDFSTLQKGDVISVEEIEAATETTCSATDVEAYREYQMAALNLRTKIEAVFRNRDGKMPTIISRAGALVILKDDEAVVETRRNIGRSIRKAARTLKQGQGVNTTKLTVEQREEHLSNLGTVSWMVGECRRKRRADARTLRKIAEARKAEQEQRAKERAAQTPRKRHSAVKEAAAVS